MKISVIITAYNKPDTLAAVLNAYSRQDYDNFDLIVADDGSTDEIARLVETYRQRVSYMITHVWHEDNGFRAAAIRNRAISATSADYVIFSDMDCIPRRGFIKKHRELAEAGWFVSGSRILMSERLTRGIVDNGLAIQDWMTDNWFAAYIQRDINRMHPLFQISLPDIVRKIPRNKWTGVMTCNLACWRRDLIAVNGFDETYENWGLEDTDLAIRLLRAGICRKSARFAAPVFHLWHSANGRHNIEDNQRRLRELIRSKRYKATRGLENYS